MIIASFSDSGTLSGQQLVPELVDDRAVRPVVRRLPVLELVLQLVDRERRRRLRHGVPRVVGGLCLLSAAVQGSSARAVLALLLIQMFPPSLAFVAVYLMVDQLDDVYPEDRLGHDRGSHALLPRRRAGCECLVDQGLLRHRPAGSRRERPDRRGDAQPDVLPHHPAARRAGAGDHLPALVHRRRRPSSSSPRSSCSARTSPRRTSPPPSACAACSPATVTTCAGDRSRRLLILAIPVVLLFQFLQRFIVGGITAGAVKG